MIDLERLCELVLACGFTHTAPLDPATIEVRQEVREMCATNSCGQYGKNWTCPPGCGELPELEKRLRQYRTGLLIQSVGEVEDSFDLDGMLEHRDLHKKRLQALQEKVPDALLIGVGCCTQCSTCTYPDEPCRSPEKQIISMEAYGMVVSDVCRANNLKYYYGPQTISYTSCILIK